MMENKRGPWSVDQGNFTSLSSKRHKSDLSISTKERKEKLSERIVALQQLVSPYGKVLSAPYLQSTPTAKMQEVEQCSLRNRGLCLVPVAYTIGVAQSNGADIWAPIKTTSPKFGNSFP
ncbi:transcription factor bHLH153-like isoform X2 [Tripterygium wilfordii]|uniref:transcription factor bHLH153-like isoform X2 n=1 Tax=Tripterygium wilfordii TaxID=458696 RepID=UPI0018F86224|nr:transcription factor bHLH153-like isoform X2 [Tripterygium wilfordii]